METVKLSRARICYLVELIRRDEEKPIIKDDSVFGDPALDRCPKCKGILAYSGVEGTHFCPYCGQRVDVNTYQL